MNRVPIVLGVGLLLAAVSASAAQQARIVGARTGSHPDFDRVVIEIDREVEVVRRPTEPGGIELQIAAVPRRTVDALGSARSRMGLVELRRADGGTLVRAPARPRAVRAFRLSNPPRVVIDLGAPGGPALPVPSGVRVLVEVEPEPEPAPEPAAPPAELEVAEVPPAPPAQPARAAPPPPAAQVEPKPPAQARAPQPPRQAPASPAPQPEPASGDGWISILVWVLVLVALAVAGGWAVLRRRGDSEESGDVEESAEVEEVDDEDAELPARAISPAELAHSADRLDALEKRLDGEVRARAQLEERLVQTQEDLKVLRDRLHRSSRAGGERRA